MAKLLFFWLIGFFFFFFLPQDCEVKVPSHASDGSAY